MTEEDYAQHLNEERMRVLRYCETHGDDVTSRRTCIICGAPLFTVLYSSIDGSRLETAQAPHIDALRPRLCLVRIGVSEP